MDTHSVKLEGHQLCQYSECVLRSAQKKGAGVYRDPQLSTPSSSSATAVKSVMLKIETSSLLPESRCDHRDGRQRHCSNLTTSSLQVSNMKGKCNWLLFSTGSHADRVSMVIRHALAH
jgi:hypothetical protein